MDRMIEPVSVTYADFNDGDELTIEPFRADAFPVIKDLIVDRSALDKIVSSGGYVSVKTGSAPEASTILSKRILQMRQWMRRRALDVVRVWPPVQMEHDALHFCESFSVCVIAAGPLSERREWKRWWRPWINLVLEIVQ